MSQKEIISYLKEQPIRVSVFGEFGTGKTTFINALIGEAILSVAVDPTTAVPTYIRYAREFNILVQLINGESLLLFKEDPPFWTRFVGRKSVLSTLRKQEGEIRDFLKDWTKEGEKADQVENITIELPLPWLENNIELVDTPGTNAGIDSHKKHTDHVSKETDIAIFLMDARQGGGKKTEFEFMNKVQKSVYYSFLVINKMDLLDKDDDEREDIIDFIKNEAIPNHWEGVIHPPIYGISSIVRLDNDLAEKEPDLLYEFSNLLNIIENMVKKERGKILLSRLANPEKELFIRAKEFESEKKYDKAHKKYYELFDILNIAEMDTSPAKDGIELCDSILNSQVDELVTINSSSETAFNLEDKNPDEALEQLKTIQLRLVEMNVPDKDVNKTVTRLKDRIKKRNIARENIDRIYNSALQNENESEFIQGVKELEKYHGFTDEAELSKDKTNMLNIFQATLIKKRDADAFINWKIIQERVDTNFENHQYEETLPLINKIEKYLPFLSKSLQKKAHNRIFNIKNKNEEWKIYKEIFTKISKEIVSAFKKKIVGTDTVNNIQNELNELRKFSQYFFDVKDNIHKFEKINGLILTIEDRLFIVKFLIGIKGIFNADSLESLSDLLESRKKLFNSISKDTKVWLENPGYFDKYPDHPTALSIIIDKSINRKNSYKIFYQLLNSLNTLKPFIKSELKKPFYEKEKEIIYILLKKRFFSFKSKNRILKDLLRDEIYTSAIIVIKKINHYSERTGFLKEAFITNFETLAKSLADIAERQAMRDDIEGAITTFQTAISSAKRTKNIQDRSKTMEIIISRIQFCEIKHSKNLHLYHSTSKSLAEYQNQIAIQEKEKEERKRKEIALNKQQEKRRQREEKQRKERREQISSHRSGMHVILWLVAIPASPFTMGITIAIAIFGSILIGMGLFDDW